MFRVMLAMCVAAQPLAAQRVPDSAFRVELIDAPASWTWTWTAIPAAAPPHAGHAAARTATAFVGTVIGGIAGGLALRLLTCGDRRGCGVDIATADAAIALGFIPGATFGAGLPSLRSPCGVGTRLGRAFRGAALGGLAGGMAGMIHRRGTAMWLGFGGAIIGSTTAVHRCQPAGPAES